MEEAALWTCVGLPHVPSRPDSSWRSVIAGFAQCLMCGECSGWKDICEQLTVQRHLTGFGGFKCYLSLSWGNRWNFWRRCSDAHFVQIGEYLHFPQCSRVCELVGFTLSSEFEQQRGKIQTQGLGLWEAGWGLRARELCCDSASLLGAGQSHHRRESSFTQKEMSTKLILLLCLTSSGKPHPCKTELESHHWRDWTATCGISTGTTKIVWRTQRKLWDPWA